MLEQNVGVKKEKVDRLPTGAVIEEDARVRWHRFRGRAGTLWAGQCRNENCHDAVPPTVQFVP